MAGTPALFIDGKFIGCPRPQSKNCSFSQRLKSGHPPGDQAPGLRFFAIFGAKTSLLPSRIARNRPISETGSLLTLPSSGESATNPRAGTGERCRTRRFATAQQPEQSQPVPSHRYFSEAGEATLCVPLLPRHTQRSGERTRHNPPRSVLLGSADIAEGLGRSTRRG
jgi:hypothetical protein